MSTVWLKAAVWLNIVMHYLLLSNDTAIRYATFYYAALLFLLPQEPLYISFICNEQLQVNSYNNQTHNKHFVVKLYIYP